MKNPLKSTVKFFDEMEDGIRARLSQRPIAYAALASIGTVLLWRGIWMVADEFGITSAQSILIGACVLLATGVFVSGFIGNSVIIAGLRREKKVVDKTRAELESESATEKNILHEIRDAIDRLEKSTRRDQ